MDELLNSQPDKVFKSGLTFTLVDVSVKDFQPVLDSMDFNILLQRVQYEVKNLKKEAVYYIKEAARAAEFGSWHGMLPDSHVKLAKDIINKIPDVLEWEAKQIWTNIDATGKYYSQPRKDGIMLFNNFLDIRFAFS